MKIDHKVKKRSLNFKSEVKILDVIEDHMLIKKIKKHGGKVFVSVVENGHGITKCFS